MPKFLDTMGRRPIAIAICDRCRIKVRYDFLVEDPNAPGLRVCPDGCRDDLDPWRLPAREVEDITLEYPRPDAPISGLTPVPQYTNLIAGIETWEPTFPWARNAAYAMGATITPLSTDLSNTDLQWWYLCVGGGRSGAAPPAWPNSTGVPVEDGTVLWLCIGIFPATAESSVALPYNGLKTLAPVTPPAPYVPPPAGLTNDGGALQITNFAGFKTSPAGLPGGAVYSSGGWAAIVPGGKADANAPLLLYFGSVTAAQLLLINGADLPIVSGPRGSGLLWNNGLAICVS